MFGWKRLQKQQRTRDELSATSGTILTQVQQRQEVTELRGINQALYFAFPLNIRGKKPKSNWKNRYVKNPIKLRTEVFKGLSWQEQVLEEIHSKLTPSEFERFVYVLLEEMSFSDTCYQENLEMEEQTLKQSGILLRILPQTCK